MQLVSADQFVDGLLAALMLEGKTKIDLENRDLDKQFAKAFDEFIDNAEELGLVPDFVMTANKIYGDSTCLRDTIFSSRDLHGVALQNPRFVKLTILMKGEPAEERLDQSIIPSAFLKQLAKKHLSNLSQ